MEAWLTEIYANASGPLISAFLLVLHIATAPCPMTLNITAMGFIGRNISDRRKVFFNGVYYALGTMVSYTLLALIMFFGANQLRISSFFQQYSEKIIGPILLLIGLYMIGLLHLNFPTLSKFTRGFERRTIFRSGDSFLLGILFELAFCPYSGVLYFGMLIPLVITTSSPVLSLAFSAAAAIPVAIFAWLLAFSVSGIGRANRQHRIRFNFILKIFATCSNIWRNYCPTYRVVLDVNIQI